MDNWKRHLRLGNHRAAVLGLLDRLSPRRGAAPDAVRARYLSARLARLVANPDLPPGVLDRRLLRRVLAEAHLSTSERRRLRLLPLPGPTGLVGAVTCALVTDQPPYEALVRRLRINRTDEQQESCLSAEFSPSMGRHLLDACMVAQDHLQRRWFSVPLQIQARHRFALEQGPAVQATGRSLGGAAALAFFSLWTGVEVPATVAVVAVVEPGPDGEGVLRETDELTLARKVEALIQERPHLRRVVVPRSQLGCVAPRLRARLVPADTLEELLDAGLGPAHEARITVPGGINLVNEVERAVADYRSGHDRRPWALKARRFEVLAAALPSDEANARFRCRCLAFQASCLLHQGETALAEPLLDEARDLFDRFRVTADASFLPWVLDRLAMEQLDVYDVERARETAAEALERAERGGLDFERLSKLHGTLGQILLAAGDLPGALDQLQAALDGIHRVRPDQCVRNHTYLVRALGVAGQPDAAHAQHREATEHLQRVPEDNRLTHQAYLAYAMAGVMLRQGEPRQAADLLLALPLSALLPLGPIAARIHKLLVRASLELGQQDRAQKHHQAVYRWLGEAPSARLRWLGATADLELAAGLMGTRNSELGARNGEVCAVAEQRARVEAALGCVPRYAGAQQRFGAVAREVLVLVRGEDPAPLVLAIRRLLDLEIY